MRVMCIDDDWCDITGKDVPNIQFGDIVHVLNFEKKEGVGFYSFIEYGPEWMYDANAFVPIEDKPEEVGSEPEKQYA